MSGSTDDKYLTTQALEWFDGVKGRLWAWLFDEHQNYKHTTAISSFVLGAVMVRIVPDAFAYAAAAGGALVILTFVAACLIPVAWLVEWGVRKISGR
jgi:hypothetical protein